jgi:2-polyprenyl-6-methoxyphenol hydroxylase-like FAD-dependent oxidoreductase
MEGVEVKVLVVGAGIAGLATARALRAWGASVEVVERAGQPQSAGAGVYLPGNAVRALHALGLGAQVAAASVAIERQRVADHRGRPLFEVDVASLWRGVGPCVAMPRADLHRVLLSGVGDVPIHWGRSPEAIETHGTGVTVTFTDGIAATYSLVIGADGAHSTVRRLAFSEVNGGPARDVGLYGWRFLVPWTDPEPVWSARLGPGSTLLTIPVGPGQLYCYCDGPRADSPPSLNALLTGYAEPARTILDRLQSSSGPIVVHSGPIEEVVAASWSHETVLLIGDAAHATSPSMAEGAAMAVEDAIVLAETLTKAGSITEALRTFEQRRRPRTDWVLEQTRRRDRTRALPPVLRNAILRRGGPRIFRSNYRPLLDQP